jgi:hypothetical protein
MRVGPFVLSLPLLVAGLHHNHGNAHSGAHGVDRRAIKVETVTVTEIEAVTITFDGGTSSATSPSASATDFAVSTVLYYKMVTYFGLQTNCSQPTWAEAQQSAGLSKDTAGRDGNPYPTLVAVANSAMVKNSCGYDVYIWSDGQETCEGPAAKGKLLEANGTYVEKLRECAEGGISLKISKNNSAAHPMQFEYTVWPDHKTVSYDISYLDCMSKKDGEKDLGECAGHEGGIQAVGGSDCPDYHCLAGQWCDKNAYVVAEFGYLPGAPVGGCTVDKGIAFELCAATRA